MHFAETYGGITGPGQRVFGVNVNGTSLGNLDIYALAGGPDRAIAETTPATVTSGETGYRVRTGCTGTNDRRHRGPAGRTHVRNECFDFAECGVEWSFSEDCGPSDELGSHDRRCRGGAVRPIGSRGVPAKLERVDIPARASGRRQTRGWNRSGRHG
ncbi:MAG: hypothetical protein JO352_34180 [Chloroflexi bacterium]|nr:hypothetical protein [Chloroflexota bacterium]